MSSLGSIGWRGNICKWDLSIAPLISMALCFLHAPVYHGHHHHQKFSNAFSVGVDCRSILSQIRRGTRVQSLGTVGSWATAAVDRWSMQLSLSSGQKPDMKNENWNVDSFRVPYNVLFVFFVASSGVTFLLWKTAMRSTWASRLILWRRTRASFLKSEREHDQSALSAWHPPFVSVLNACWCLSGMVLLMGVAVRLWRIWKPTATPCCSSPPSPMATTPPCPSELLTPLRTSKAPSGPSSSTPSTSRVWPSSGAPKACEQCGLAPE